MKLFAIIALFGLTYFTQTLKVRESSVVIRKKDETLTRRQEENKDKI